jgi:hypothetical protein
MTDSTKLNQAAAHETGVYQDPAAEDRIVVAYSTDSAAFKARDDLVAHGIPEDSIQVLHHGNKDEFSNMFPESGGFLDSIRSLFISDQEIDSTDDKRRGYAVLCVTPTPATDRARLVSLISDTHPQNFDAKLEQWRQAAYEASKTT